MLACPAQAAVAKAVERRVLALVLVVLLVQLLDQDLNFVVGQRRRDVLHVVLHQRVIPVDGDDLLEVDADVEQRVVACALWHALRAQRLQAGRAILDWVIRGLGRFRKTQLRALDPLVVQRAELIKGRGSAVVVDGVAHRLVPAKVRQVQEVARVATVNQNLRLLWKNLSAGLAQQGRAGFQKPLHLSGRDRLFDKKENVRAA